MAKRANYLRRIKNPTAIGGFAFSPNGEDMAVADYDGRVRIGNGFFFR